MDCLGEMILVVGWLGVGLVFGGEMIVGFVDSLN